MLKVCVQTCTKTLKLTVLKGEKTLEVSPLTPGIGQECLSSSPPSIIGLEVLAKAKRQEKEIKAYFWKGKINLSSQMT